MKKFLNFIDNFEEKILTILLPIMVIVVFAATFFRFTKLMIIPWSEELARYIMVWIIFLGIGVGAKTNSHFTVDNLVNALPKSTHKAFFIIRSAIIIGFCGVIIYISIGFINSLMSMGQVSPSLQIPMWIAYAAVPVGMVLMIVRTIQYVVRKFKEEKESI